LKDAESLWVETNIGGRQYILGVISRQPKHDKGFSDDVIAILHQRSDKRQPYIICGDININLLQHTTHQVHTTTLRQMKVIIVDN